MIAKPLNKSVDALVVNDITKYFHMPRPPLWKRLMGIQTDLPAAKNLPPTKPGEKAPVIAVDHLTFSVKREKSLAFSVPTGQANRPRFG